MVANIFFVSYYQHRHELTSSQTVFLKSDSHLQNFVFICFNDSPSKMMKNAFCFILKALFVLKMFKIMFRLFGHVEKMALFER